MTQIGMPIHFINAKQVCERTTLYSLTSHPQAEHFILCHPTGQDLVKANNANIEFNKGIIAHHNSTINKCPSSNKDSSFCEGWNYAKRYLR